jgi:two-component system, OmpR family, phosphate regulon sensor histidine kinase PhoR
MKKVIFTILIYFMAIVIVGLIGLQYFFIRVSYDEKKGIYDQHIYAALLKATNRLTNRQSIMCAYDILNKESKDSIKPVDPMMFSFTYSDGTSINIEFDSKVKPDYMLNNELKPEDYMINQQNKLLHMENYFTDMLSKNRSNLYEMLKEIETEINIGNLPLSKRYTNKALQNTLSEELKNQGITGPFRYALVLDNNIHPHLKSDNFTEADLSNAYKIRLLPNAIFSKQEYLAVSFPEQSKFLLASISMQITLSVIFVLMILVTFFISTYVILRQKKLSEIKNDFISNMTHEFKTPIATIRLAADSLINPKVSQNNNIRNKFTDIISQETHKLNSQVEKILQVSALEKDNIKIDLQKHDLHEIIKEAVDNMKLPIEQKNVVTDLQLNADKHHYLVDKEHMVNVINNLLDNALKYSGNKQPIITVQTYNKNKFLYIVVKDNGIGMDNATISKIFDKFYRANGGNIHNVKGFGLGLHYVNEIVNAHKGLIDVKSTPGKGSTFIIKLTKK